MARVEFSEEKCRRIAAGAASDGLRLLGAKFASQWPQAWVHTLAGPEEEEAEAAEAAAAARVEEGSEASSADSSLMTGALGAEGAGLDESSGGTAALEARIEALRRAERRSGTQPHDLDLQGRPLALRPGDAGF